MNKVSIYFDEGILFEDKNIKSLIGVTGLYFIYNSSISIQYPFHKSKIIYIGMSEKKTNSIGRRLQSHMEGTSGNEGILSYGEVNTLLFTHINFKMLKGQWPLNVEALESFFIKNFVENYGVYPICNNKSGYDITDTDLKVNFEINWENFH